MHLQSLEYFCYVDRFDNSLISNLPSNTSIIYRSYDTKYNIKTIIRIKKLCKKKNFKFYLSNDVRLAIKLDLDGAYLSAFNKSLKHNAFSLKKKFRLLGSAHNLKEIRMKEKQKIYNIFLSPLFKTKKNKSFLGFFKFMKLMKHTKKDIVCLGGINKKNIKKIKLLKINKIAGISIFYDISPKNNEN